MYSLPTPARNYLPRLFVDVGDSAITALADKMDIDLVQLKEDVRKFRLTRRIEAAPRSFVNEFGYLVSAGIINQDDDRTAAQKAYRATQGWVNRGTWLLDVKIKIDTIAGGNSQILGGASVSSDSIIVGGAEKTTDNYWSTIGTNLTAPDGYFFDTPTDDIIMAVDDGSNNTIIGTDGVGDYGPDILGSPYFTASGDPNLGDDIVGSGDEIQLPGNVYINVDNTFLSAEQISQIVASIEATSCPAYFKVFLCYLDNFGNPVVYSGGTIG